MLEQTVEGIEDTEAFEGKKQHVVLRPHTFYDLEDVLYFSDKHWEGLLSKRGAPLEEVGYVFLRRSEAPTPVCRSLGMFRAKAGTGSAVEVSSDPRVVEAINILTSRHSSLTVAPYHTHPIDEPSRGDMRTMYATYKETGGLVQDNIIIGPRRTMVIRVFPLGEILSYKDLIGTNFLKIVKLNDAVLDRYREESDNLAREYISILKSLR